MNIAYGPSVPKEGLAVFLFTGQKPTGATMSEETPAVEPQTPEQKPGVGQEPTTGLDFNELDSKTQEFVKSLRQEAAKTREELTAARKANEQFADYGELQKAAAKLQELEDAEKSELEKLQEQLATAQADQAAAEKQSQETLVRSAFVAAAASHDVMHPEDAYALADKSDVKITDGKVEGVTEAVEALVKADRLPLKAKAQTAPNINASTGGKQTGEKLTDDEKQELGAIYGVKPEYIQ